MQLRRTSAWRALCRIPRAVCIQCCESVSVACTSSSRPTPCEPTKRFSSPMVQEWWVNAAQEAVISRKAIMRAERIVTEADDPRSNKRPFYDSDTRRCLVCDTRLEGSYSTHSHTVDHIPRVALLKRTISMILTFLEQASSSPSTPPQALPEKAGSLAGSKRLLKSALPHTATATAPAPSCFHTLYAESPLFGEDGVPSRGLLYHRPHTLREFDLVDVIMRRWWNTLHNPPPKRGSLSFDRLLSLSSTELQMRRWRVRYLLYFLKSRGVLRVSMSVRGDDMSAVAHSSERIHRGEAFERLEMVGDSFFKSLTPDRMHAVFPADEGGLTTGLQYFERTLDSNHGLLAIYDYLGLDDIMGCYLANNKAKADVVEAIIGELKVLLWSADVVWGMEYYAVPGERATLVYLRALVAHTIAELGHTVLMWQLESTLRNCREFILKHTVEGYLTANEAREHRAKGEESEFEFVADLPKYAPLPPLLAWERQRPGASVPKGEVQYATKQLLARAPPSPQDPLRRLAPTASCIPEGIRKHYAVGQKKWNPNMCAAAVEALCDSLTLSALPRNSGRTADALSSDPQSGSLPLYPEAQPSKTPPASRDVRRHVLPALVTANCIVICTTNLPLATTM